MADEEAEEVIEQDEEGELLECRGCGGLPPPATAVVDTFTGGCGSGAGGSDVGGGRGGGGRGGKWNGNG